MKFGVREICDVVLRAKSAQKIGDKVFYKNEPVLYFDSLKTSSVEGAATTVYAQGGRGNARLIAWEGERTVTFTMEDALISPIGFSILTGAGLIAAKDKPVIMHQTEQTDKIRFFDNSNPPKEVTAAEKGSDKDVAFVEIQVTKKPYLGENRGSTTEGNTTSYTSDPKDDFIYVMVLNDQGEVDTEPYIASEVHEEKGTSSNKATTYKIRIYASDSNHSDDTARVNDLSKFTRHSAVLVDYYTAETSDAFQINITPDKFGGNFYLEASTLFRDTNGVDMPAEFIIPNCKVQSNFTFTMASSGDPSTFTFTMDAFPDYTRWDKTKKVYAAIQVLNTSDLTTDFERLGTAHDYGTAGTAATTGYNAAQKPRLEEGYII